MKNLRVVALTQKDLGWGWDDKPYYNVPGATPKFYNITLYVDPFPGYSHDSELVIKELKRVANIFPIPAPVVVCVLDRECPSRNQWTM